jgi:putative nucleotidyltransferase with HDIG domain
MEARNTTDLNPEVADLIETYERVKPQPLDPRERRAETYVAAVCISAAVALAVGVTWDRPLRPLQAVLLVVAFAAAKRIRFTVGAGHTSPTQLVLVPMLLLLPAPLVPLLVIAGLVLGSLPDYLSRRTSLDRIVLVAGDGAYALAPAVVLIAAGVHGAAWSDWPVLAAALAAQLLVDAGVSTLRESLALGVPPALQPGMFGWVALVDALLAPIGFMAALAGSEQAGGWLLVVPLLSLIAVFASERNARIGHEIELGRAYRGTTLLLSDVLQADDEYTGSHSWGVVALALRVAEAMGLDHRQRRNVEFGALLHDIGKIAVPNEIINKTSALTEEEWLVIKTHTVEGERMLQRVGGVLGEVGRIVRSSHERWDGSGYPDGLAGHAIPIEAGIVSCCDAFDAMTTDRSYRAAMPAERALAELRANSGTQFNPRVVDFVVELLEADLETEAAAARAATAGYTPPVESMLGTALPAP